MAQFTSDLLSICKAYNLEENDVILCFALAAGAIPSDAYQITHKTKPTTTQQQADNLCRDLIEHKPGMKIIINRIKNKRDPATFKKQQQEEIKQALNKEVTEEERDELKTREGLINKIIDNIGLTTGKDTISGLQTLAKLQGLDHPDEQEQEEKRSYFLPWVSNCRSCALMKLYQKTINDKQPEKG